MSQLLNLREARLLYKFYKPINSLIGIGNINSVCGAWWMTKNRLERFELRMSPRRLTLTTLFGVIIFAFKTVLPTPIDKAFVVIQALLLSLGYLLLGAPGATYVSMVGGLLTTLWRAPLAPFTTAFALLYGLLIDGLSSIFKVREENNDVGTKRLIATVTVSTAVVGLASYYTTVHVLAILPRNPLLEMGVFIAGVINGLIGGYLSVIIWKKNLRGRKWTT